MARTAAAPRTLGSGFVVLRSRCDLVGSDARVACFSSFIRSSGTLNWLYSLSDTKSVGVKKDKDDDSSVNSTLTLQPGPPPPPSLLPHAI